MAKRKIEFVNGEIYHIVIKAIDGLKLFRDKKDFLRMIHDLFEFNDSNSVISTFRVKSHRVKINETRKGGVSWEGISVTVDVDKDDVDKGKRKRKLLVEILAFCLMPNHVHLLVRQLSDGGISRFMKKFGAYSNYYNKKYGRSGRLLTDKFRAVHIKNNLQLETVFVYIHTNPVALVYPNWKEKGIKELKKAISFIENYRWSSCSDYLGKKNFPSVTSREFMLKVIGGPEGCRAAVNSWLRYKKELTDLDYVAID